MPAGLPPTSSRDKPFPGSTTNTINLPAASCLCMATLHNLISLLQLLSRLVHTVPPLPHLSLAHLCQQCTITNPNHPVSMALASSPTPATMQRARPPDSGSVSAHCIHVASLVPLAPLAAPCLLSHSPSKIFIYFPASSPAAAANLAGTPLLLPDLEMQPTGTMGQPKQLSSLSDVKWGCSSSAHKPLHAGAQHVQHTASAQLHPHLCAAPGCVLKPHVPSSAPLPPRCPAPARARGL